MIPHMIPRATGDQVLMITHACLTLTRLYIYPHLTHPCSAPRPLLRPYSLTTCLRPRRRLPLQERIDFLARVRNAALEPLLNPNSSLHDCHPVSRQVAEFQPDYVIFINDIFFCYPDVLRLMQYQGDATCGMDFWTAVDRSKKPKAAAAEATTNGAVATSSSAAAAVAAVAGAGEGLGPHQTPATVSSRGGVGAGAGPGPGPPPRPPKKKAKGRAKPLPEASIKRLEERSRNVLRKSVLADPAAPPPPEPDSSAPSRRRRRLHHAALEHGWGLQDTLLFYDKWVARDVSGGSIRNWPPYSHYKPSADRIQAGLPLPVYCCWDGVVVLRFAPFMQHGVRFRSHLPGECSASECSLMCDDFHRLGFRGFVMDPNVRVAYTWAQTPALYEQQQVKHIAVRTWPEVEGEAREVMRAMAGSSGSSSGGVHYDQVQCCDLKPGSDRINFERDCFKHDVMGVNYTQRYEALAGERGRGWNDVSFGPSTTARPPSMAGAKARSRVRSRAKALLEAGGQGGHSA